MVLRGEMTDEQELRYVLSRKGSMWDREWYDRFLATRWWKKLRQVVLERDDYACVECRSRVNLHVDHVEYPGCGLETPEHLQTLCYRCHASKTKNRDLLAWKKYGKTEIGFGGGDQLFSVLRRERDGADE